MKDLRIFHTRDPSQLLIVDNSIYAFAFNLDSGVPIISFYHHSADQPDEELRHMVYYLQCIQQVPDIRTLNREAFELTKLYNEIKEQVG